MSRTLDQRKMISHIRKLHSLETIFWASCFTVNMNEQDHAAVVDSR